MRINERLDAESAANGWWDRRHEPAIREKLVQHYQQFAERIASTVWRAIDHRSLEWDEMLCAANLGLMQAIDRFNPTSHAAFTSFATWRVKGECIELARSHDWVPQGARDAEKRGEKSIPLMLPLMVKSPKSGDFVETDDAPAPAVYDATRDTEWLSDHAPKAFRPLIRGLFLDPEDEHLNFKATAQWYFVTEGQLRLVARHAIARAVNG